MTHATLLSELDGKTATVSLQGRTLVKDGNWNSLCLPFDLADFTGTPLEGATVKALNTSASNLSSDGTLTLAFTEASSITAGKAYIVKWAMTGDDIANPEFANVTIKATEPAADSFNNAFGDDCQFVGQFSPFDITTDNMDEVVLLGAGNTLGYSATAPRTLRSFRAHFLVPTTAGGPAVRAYRLDFGEEDVDGIISAPVSTTADTWYDANGRRLADKPTTKGIYVKNGQKFVVK